MASAYLTDGFATTITFDALPAIKLIEVSITPPGVQGGGGVDQTGMSNTAWRTQLPKGLKTMTPMSGVFYYDPTVYTDIIGYIQVNDNITVTFSDGSTVDFFGWLDDFAPAELVEGTRPTAACTFLASSIDDASGSEAGPTITAAA